MSRVSKVKHSANSQIPRLAQPIYGAIVKYCIGAVNHGAIVKYYTGAANHGATNQYYIGAANYGAMNQYCHLCRD